MQRTLELHPPGYYTPAGDAQSWYKGALGEIAVAGVLARLGPEWTVLHSVPVGRADSDIDHVVIGPAGVFTINSKNHAGQKIWIAGRGLLVSGNKTSYISAAISEAARAELALSKFSGLTVPVTPIIALVNPGPRTVKAPADGGVRVVADWELLDVLDTHRVFSDEQLHRIVSVATRAQTWHESPAPEVDPRLLAIHFNAIMARELQGSRPAPANAKSLTTAAAGRPNKPRGFGWRLLSAIGDALEPTPAPRSRGRSRRKKNGVGAELLTGLLGIGLAWFLLVVVMPVVLASLQGSR